MVGLKFFLIFLGFQQHSHSVILAVNNSSDGREWLRMQFDRNYSFFYVELTEGTILSHSVEENENFPAQFGREVRC